MRYANVRLLETSSRDPNGDERLRLRLPARESRCGGDKDAPNLTSAACCDSKDCWIFLYSFLSEPAAFVV